MEGGGGVKKWLKEGGKKSLQKYRLFAELSYYICYLLP